MPATKIDLTRAKAADGPQGSEAAGDELMTSEIGPSGPGERWGMGIEYADAHKKSREHQLLAGSLL